MEINCGSGSAMVLVVKFGFGKTINCVMVQTRDSASMPVTNRMEPNFSFGSVMTRVNRSGPMMMTCRGCTSTALRPVGICMMKTRKTMAKKCMCGSASTAKPINSGIIGILLLQDSCSLTAIARMMSGVQIGRGSSPSQTWRTIPFGLSISTVSMAMSHIGDTQSVPVLSNFCGTWLPMKHKLLVIQCNAR